MKNLVFILFFAFYNKTLAQNPYNAIHEKKVIDSLKRELVLSANDSLRAIVSLKLTREYLINRDKENFKKYYYQAKKYSKDNVYLNDLTFFRYAGFYMLEQNYDAYIKHLEQADQRLSKYDIEEVNKIRTNILFNKSIYYNDKNKTKSLNILTKELLPLANKIGDYEMIAQAYKSIAIKFYNEKNYNKSQEYIRKTINIFKANKLRNEELLTELYLLQSEVLSSLKKFKESQESLKKAYNLIEDYPNSDFQSAYYYTTGLYFHQKGMYSDAIKSFDIGIKKSLDLTDLFMENRLKLMKVISLKELNKYKEAKEILVNLLKNKNILVEDKIDYLKELAIISKKLNDLPNAILAYEEFFKLNDSISKTQFEEKSAYLEKELNELENAKKLEELRFEKENAKQAAVNNQLKYIITLLAVVLLIVTIIIFWLRFVKIKKLNKEKELALTDKINALKNEKELISIYAMMEGEENERKRIARDLHDGLGGNLSSIKMRVAKIANDSSSIEEMSKIHHLIDNSVKELRQVAYNLIPETLLKLGLDQALHDLCINYSSDEVSIHYHSSQIDNNIIKPHQISIYRIVQELIHNAIKHAEASEIIVDCSQNENLILITVEDNGKGFDITTLEKNKGIGFKSLNNRIELLNGKMDIASDKSQGTNINIELFITTNS